MTPHDLAVARAHPELAGLATLLDPEAVAAVTAPWGGGYGVERLRLKPGASVTATLRPGDGTGPWLIARALAPEPWRTKRGKDIRAAQLAADRSVRSATSLPGPSGAAPPTVCEVEAARLLVVLALADRRLAGLTGLLPDAGIPVRLAGGCGDEDRRPAAADPSSSEQDPRADARCTVHTLSHNPARRFVGHARPLHGDDPGRVVRLHRDRPREVVPFFPGRPWRGGDPLSRVAALARGRARRAAERGRPWHRRDVSAALTAALAGLAAVDVLGLNWSERARRLVAVLHGRLPQIAVAPAHGDFSPDQLVVADTCGGRPVTEAVHVLDWDRAGLWPLGWDAATWQVTSLLDGRPARPAGTASDAGAAVWAAAALIRTPEPFRRRRRGWVESTESLLALAEECLTAGTAAAPGVAETRS